MEIKANQFYAHTPPKAGGDWHLLSDHLEEVARQAFVFAEGTPLAEEARLAGTLHDLGKYGDLFQERLHGRAHGVDHWSAGAWHALTQYRAIAVAIAVQGHHLGLRRISPDELRRLDPKTLATNHPLNLKLSQSEHQELIARMVKDGVAADVPDTRIYPSLRETASAMLDVRMLYSALVDADFLSTEAHFNSGTPGWSRPSTPDLQAGKSLDHLLAHIQSIRASSDSASAVNSIRDDLLNACMSAAGEQPGVWTLSAPTGAGKTLAMLAFALKHAKDNGMRRVICVIPYLSIVEQTANVYNEVFGQEFGRHYILEHHSLADVAENAKITGELDSDNERLRERRLLAENWDAPIVLTTSVQMLESLFANRVSPCRKLHRLANSVILFDEVQTLPQHLAVATLAALSHLTERYGASVVFSTATQPAFDALSKPVAALKDSGRGWSPIEIAPPTLNLFSRARRTRVIWPDAGKHIAWPEVAEMIEGHPQALCIVNLKRHAHALMDELREKGIGRLMHLSTSMCPAHRIAVLDQVRKRLNQGEPCRLVATQCVEAGVDLDFPVVFRALGPLDSIAQAAGRCNRGGKSLELGSVHVFIPEDEAYPKGGGYEQAAAVTLSLLRELGPDSMDIHDPALFHRYYRDLYSITKAWGVGKAADLKEAIQGQDFEEVAKLYRLIKEDTVSILVPFDQVEYDALAQEARDIGLTGDWMRRARPHTISIYRPRDDAPVWQRMERIRVGRNDHADDWFIYLDAKDYDKDTGFAPPSADALWIS